MELVLNEVSFQQPRCSVDEAERELLAWVEIYKQLSRESSALHGKAIQSPCRVDKFHPVKKYTWKQIIGAMKNGDDRRKCLTILNRLAVKHAVKMDWIIDGDNPCKAVELVMALGKDQCNMFSLSANGRYLAEKITARNLVDGHTEELKNIAEVQHILRYADLLDIRIYEKNSKHGMENRHFSKGIASAFDLKDNDAQKLLVKGIRCGKKIYAKRGQQYYTFQNHLNRCYHGYIDDGLPENVRRRLDMAF